MSDERIAELEKKAAMRRGKPGMAENVAEIEAEIARLKDAQQAQWPVEGKK